MLETKIVLEMSMAISRHKPSTYTSTSESIELENWIREFEKVLIVVRCLEGHMVDQDAFYLKEDVNY